MNPKVSICIPAYKQPHYLKRLIESIIDQIFSDYEVVITDDTPDDSVKNVVDLYKDERIKYYKNNTPLGTPENWNEVIRKSTGEYIKIMHHDDWFKTANSLNCFVEEIEKSQATIAFCQSENRNEDGVISINAPTNNKIEALKTAPVNLFIENIIGAPSATILKRKEFLFDKNIKWFVDVEFYVRLLIAADRSVCYIAEPLVCIGVHSEQVTRKCINSMEVIYSEFLYSYNKFYNLKIVPKNELLRLCYIFFLTNKLQSINEIQQLSGVKLSFMQIIIFYCVIFPVFIKKTIKKMKSALRKIRRI